MTKLSIHNVCQFTGENILNLPEERGVFVLLNDCGEALRIEAIFGGQTIRSRLRSIWKCLDGYAPIGATAIGYEVTAAPEQRAEELEDEHLRAYGRKISRIA